MPPVFDATQTPILIIKESRNNLRVSLTQKGVVVRVPKFMDKNTQDVEVKKLLHKFFQKINAKSTIYPKKTFKIDDTATILGQVFQIHCIDTSRIQINAHENQIYIPKKYAEIRTDLFLKKILFDFLSVLEKRVRDINQATLQANFHAVEIKNIKSKWGSCSNKGLLTFSTRLLLMPLWVIDYVIVHELCHLIHFNHSKQFWNLVALHFPKYKMAKDYLKNTVFE